MRYTLGFFKSENDWSKWVKIGEVDHSTGMFVPGIYSSYAVMERINMTTGMRQYKEIFMASCTHGINLKSQPEPL